MKVWLVGFVPLWIAAKIHTFATMDEPSFMARHWPYWAAMLAWPALIALCYWLLRTLKPERN